MNTISEKFPWTRPIVAAAAHTHDPQTALLRLETLAESAEGRYKEGAFTETCALILARVLATSAPLSGRLAADPLLTDILCETCGKSPASPANTDFHGRFFRRTGDSAIMSEAIKTLHRLHTVGLIEICAWNADPGAPIPEINRALSQLADAAVETCLELAHRELCERAGADGKPHSLAVLGLGKLGGRELNVSSDVDLIYLFSDDGSSWGRYDSWRYHTMLAERLTRLLTEATELGAFYRVDTRLRADGASGPLVRTPEDYLRYLEMRGEAWERQMLIKARPVAGCIEIGRGFLENAGGFIYPSSLSRSPNREIVELKRRIEARLVAEGSKKTHLKLLPGGIRDIEFITQCLQLLTGGAHPVVRVSGTLAALDALLDIDALSEAEHETLATSYRLYRSVENALQWRELLPAFTLPDDPAGLDAIAAYLAIGIDSDHPGHELSERIDRSRAAVRSIFEDIFSPEEGESFAEAVMHAAMHPDDESGTKRFMESLGFAAPLDHAKTLSRLVFGETGSLTSGFDIHDSIERFVPSLLKQIGELPDPGGVLDRFTRIVSSYHARHVLFDILDARPSFAELLLTISGMSEFLTGLIEQDPSLLDWLVEEGEILHPLDRTGIARELSAAAGMPGDVDFSRKCRAVRNRECLRIGARDITGLAGDDETFRELSGVASAVVYASAVRVLGKLRETGAIPKDYSFSVMAAGRLGSGMMDFGSDLDLIYVYRAPAGSRDFDAASVSIRLAQRFQSLLTGDGGALKVYDVDARLRPEGGNSVLAVSLDEYRRYLAQRASVWERLALVRATHIAGSARLGKQVEEAVGDFVYGAPLRGEDVLALMDIRARMIDAAAKRYPGKRNVKSGSGGIADIDFIAQAWAVHYGSGQNVITKRDTPGIIRELGKAEIMSRHDVSTLLEQYSFLVKTEKAIRIGSGRAINTIPDTPEESGRIAGRLGFGNIRRFRKRLDDVCSLTAGAYDRLMKDLLSRAGDGETGR